MVSLLWVISQLPTSLYAHAQMSILSWIENRKVYQRQLSFSIYPVDGVAHRNIGFRLFVHRFRLAFWSIKSFENRKKPGIVTVILEISPGGGFMSENDSCIKIIVYHGCVQFSRSRPFIPSLVSILVHKTPQCADNCVFSFAGFLSSSCHRIWLLNTWLTSHSPPQSTPRNTPHRRYVAHHWIH